jgi:hypothetical protein
VQKPPDWIVLQVGQLEKILVNLAQIADFRWRSVYPEPQELTAGANQLVPAEGLMVVVIQGLIVEAQGRLPRPDMRILQILQ